jgi:Domain of unknown function (DUF4157)
MRTFDLEASSDRFASGKHRMPFPSVHRSPARSVFEPSGTVLQRTACACGGGCPRCEERYSQSQAFEGKDDANRAKSSALPHNVKTGFEGLSGIEMDDVRVHYDSPRPAEIRALAHTDGSDIYLGPGQEEHLAHEAWHAVQQKQGRVRPTMQANGVAINDDPGLEREADQMSAKVGSFAPIRNSGATARSTDYSAVKGVAQRKLQISGLDEPRRKTFVNMINDGSTVKFELDQAGLLQQKDKTIVGNDEYSKQLIAGIRDPQTVILNLVSKDDSFLVDQFRTGKVDYDDLASMPIDLVHNWLVHIVVERFGVPNYEADKATADYHNVYGPAHIKAHEAQERQMKEWFPTKNIKYVKSFEDPATKKVDGAGNGSIDYIFDFTDVRHVFTHSMVGGVMKQDVISSRIEIVR